MLIADAAILLIADAVTDGVIRVDNFGWALLASLVVAAVSVVIAVFVGSDDTSSIRIAQRIARRQGIIASTDVPGIVPRSTGSHCLCSAGRCATATHRTWPAGWPTTHRLAEWETDLSSQTGASQAGILPVERGHLGLPLGGEGDRDADDLLGTAGLRGDRAPACDRHRPARGGGASRGNLLSGEAEDVILTVSRMEAEKKSNPGYRAFLANGDNVTRTLVLFVWEVILEWTAALRAIRRDAAREATVAASTR